MVNLDVQENQSYIDEALRVARAAGCQRHDGARRGGSVVVSKAGDIIGRGSNGPAAGIENQRRCTADKDHLHKKIIHHLELPPICMESTEYLVQ